MKIREKWPAFRNRFGITEQQFWSLIEAPKNPFDCRLWLGAWGHGGYGVLHFDRSGLLANTIYSYLAYHLVFEIDGPREKYNGMHIGHSCGLAPCCNPLHLRLITKSQNSQEAWEHKRILDSIGEEKRVELRASGMGFREIARALDIPGGPAFKMLYGKPNRAVYPAHFVDDMALERQPKEWAVGRYDDAYIQANIQRRKAWLAESLRGG